MMLPLKYWYVFTSETLGDAVKQLNAVENVTPATPYEIIERMNAVLTLSLQYKRELERTSFKETVVVANKKYSFVDPSKAPIGWLADFSMIDKNKPEYLCAMLYYPDGVKYGTVDQYGNILYPMGERAELFKEHFPLAYFTHALGRFARAMESIAEYTRTHKAVTGKDATWDEVFYALAKFYNMGFFDVMDINIRTFYHLVRVANAVVERENERYRKARQGT